MLAKRQLQKFISNILDIIDEQRLKSIMKNINKKGNSAEELHSAYKMAHSIYRKPSGIRSFFD